MLAPFASEVTRADTTRVELAAVLSINRRIARRRRRGYAGDGRRRWKAVDGGTVEVRQQRAGRCTNVADVEDTEARIPLEVRRSERKPLVR